MTTRHCGGCAGRGDDAGLGGGLTADLLGDGGAIADELGAFDAATG